MVQSAARWTDAELFTDALDFQFEIGAFVGQFGRDPNRLRFVP
jgi:hypothetical protein